MDKSEECRRYKWTSSATNLLVSIWCHDSVQNQLKISSRNQPIWESIARYMTRKGFQVTGLQCKTRIKNMLCTYHEAVRKNDQSSIEPYFDIFKKVLSKKNPKKKDSKALKVKQVCYFEEINDSQEASLDSNSFDANNTTNQDTADVEYQTEFSQANSTDYQTLKPSNNNDIIKEFENIIVKTINSQTKAITSAIKMQAQIIERLLAAERKKLETMVSLERESRKQLEARLDRLLSKFEENSLPQVTYMGTIIDTRQDPVET